MSDIFISYSSKDETQTKIICQYLESRGFHCWISCRDIKTGEDYPNAITKAIRESKIFLVIISKHSLSSVQVRKELTIANNLQASGLKLFMVMLDDTLNPERLNDSFDYILAGIQACWWSKSKSRIDLVEQFSKILPADPSVTEQPPNLDASHVRTQTDSNPPRFAKHPEPQNTPKIPDKSFAVTREKLIQKPYIICIVLLLLTMFSAIMIHSASAEYCQETYSNAFFYTERQIVFAFIGMVSVICFSRMSLAHFKKYIPYFSAISLLLVLLLKSELAMGISYPMNQWLNFGSLSIYPGVIAILGYILYIAYFTETHGLKMQQTKYITCIWAISGIFAVILLVCVGQLNLTLLVLAIGFGTTYVFSNAKKFHFITLIAFFAAIVFSFVDPLFLRTASNHRYLRIQAWFHPEDFANSYGYVPLQIKKVLTTCGFFGKGLSQGDLFHNISSSSWNENIFALVCEELGWLGALVLILLFIILLWQLFQIARIAVSFKDCFGTVLTFGVFLHILTETVLNIAVHLNLLPYTNCSLPFMSYKGSHLLFLFIEIGCVLSINRNCLNYKQK